MAPPPGRRSIVTGLLGLATIALGACGRLQAPVDASRHEGDAAAPPATRDPDAPIVERVADGDSFTARLPDGRQLGIRIAGIDAPERDQPWADASRDHLEALLARPGLRIDALKTDPFGRVVARVRANGEDLGLLQVKAGLARHFARYAADQHPDERIAYARAEREARARRAGLWHDTAPVPPWQHRQRQRAG
jgi:endonuclease YncB( thermonuclease family)